ncbi:MAG TPA: oligosaccharide flippase family protein [Candidatus Nanoarchaeia archaeon]|nr:oligosaccharide flippase family protein [Candidatus Nanoarchaeia archaeon]
MDPFKSWFWWKSHGSKQVDMDLFKTTAMLGLMTLAGTVFNLLFHVVTSRKLGPEEYGTVGVITSIILAVTIAGLVSEMVITKFISYYRTRSQVEMIMYLSLSAFKIFFSAGVGVALLLFVFSGPVGDFFNMTGKGAIFWLGLGIILASLEPVVNGTLRGLQEFFQLSLLKLFDPLLRFIFVLVLFFLQFKTNGAIAAFVFGALAAYLLALKPLWKWRHLEPYKIKRKDILKYAWPVCYVSLALSILLYLDVVFAKHYLTKELAGHYLALSMLFKVPYMISVSMASVFFPKVVEAFSTSQETAPYFKSILRYHLACCGVLLAVFLFFPNWVVSTIFGPNFGGGDILFAGTLAFTLLSIINLVYCYKLAREEYDNIALLWLALMCDLIFTLLFHSSLKQFVTVQIILMVVLFIVVLLLEKKVVFEKVYSKPYKQIHVEE